MENRDINSTTSNLHEALDVYSEKISELRIEAASIAETILSMGSAHWAINPVDTRNVLKKIEDIKSKRESLDSYKDSHLNDFNSSTPSCNE